MELGLKFNLLPLEVVENQANNFQLILKHNFLFLTAQITDERSFHQFFGITSNPLKYDSMEIAWDDMTELPDEIGKYQNLESLVISNTKTRYLSNQLKRLRKLGALHIFCELAEIPSFLGQMQQLKVLRLKGDFEELPASFFAKSQIEFLHLSSQNLSQLPRSIGNLTDLKKLSIQSDQMEQLPDVFDQLRNLEHLHLSLPKLKSLPESFGQLYGIKTINFDADPLRRAGTSLKQIPSFFRRFKRLEYFSINGLDYMDWNDLIQAWPKITHLSLTNCKLNEIPFELKNKPHLSHLNLASNEIEVLPEWFHLLFGLKSLDLRNNNITDLPQDKLFNLSQLNTLVLFNNPIPSERKQFLKQYFRGKILNRIFIK